MIIEFSVKNFRSIKEIQTLSFQATKLNSNLDKFPDVDRNNIVIDGELRVLKTIGIYGANASGKSNIIRAYDFFRKAVSDLPSPESRLSLLADPFLFQPYPEETESYFQIIFTHDSKKYRYGFTVMKNLSQDDKGSKEIITSEWLYGTKEKNQVKYFLRKGQNIEKDTLPNGKNIPDVPHKHTLFLTHASAFDKGVCETVRRYIGGYTISNFIQGDDFFRPYTMRFLENSDEKKNLLNFLSSFNLKYTDIIFEKEKDSKKDNYPQNKIYLTKSYKADNGQDIRLNLKETESAGTQKLFDLAGLLMRAFNLAVGGVIILDELDSNFHPSLVIKLIQIFNSPEINKANVQLLFTSHDTNLMDPGIMRRDQFYFTEKNTKDETRLYSLADLKGIRNDADFARQYLRGYYGALPVLDDYSLPEKRNYDGSLEY